MDARSSLKGRRDDNDNTRCADEKWPIASERRARSQKFCTLGSNVIDALRALRKPLSSLEQQWDALAIRE